MEALISVIIPIYNMEAYLARCLDSVLNNTYRNLEVLCVDDGSKDASAEILRAYAEKDSRIVPIFKENGGVSSARNAGLDRMTGEYLTFVDPDDYVHPQYVELLYRALQESGTEVAICGIDKVEEEEPVQTERISCAQKFFQVKSFSQVFKDNKLKAYCCRKMISANLASQVRFREDLPYMEDTVFFSEACENAKDARAACLPSSLYFYFQREASLTTKIRLAHYVQVLKIFYNKLLRSDRREDIYLDQTLKRGLNLRYLAAHIKADRKIAKESDAILKKCRKLLWRSKEYSTKTKIVLLLMISFPGLYWLFRIKREPFVLKWERVERKKRRAMRTGH